MKIQIIVETPQHGQIKSIDHEVSDERPYSLHDKLISVLRGEDVGLVVKTDTGSVLIPTDVLKQSVIQFNKK